MKAERLWNAKVIAAKDQISSDLSGESVVLNFKNAIYYGLDPIGTRIWSLIQKKPVCPGEIVDFLIDEYRVTPRQCRRDVLKLLKKMISEGLVEVREEAH